MRGYSMLIIVQELMYRTFVEAEGRAPRRHEIPKPCDHFDLIVGTGTGGLIALMLGRMRLDLETCKELYVRMTRVVFETDKTIAGIPYRSTLFKASKLEEAIQQAVQEHTSSDRDENDGRRIGDLSSALRGSLYSSSAGPRRNPSNASTLSFSARSPTTQMARPAWTSRHGDPHARLYDARENRTKTLVTRFFYTPAPFFLAPFAPFASFASFASFSLPSHSDMFLLLAPLLPYIKVRRAAHLPPCCGPTIPDASRHPSLTAKYGRRAARPAQLAWPSSPSASASPSSTMMVLEPSTPPLMRWTRPRSTSGPAGRLACLSA